MKSKILDDLTKAGFKVQRTLAEIEISKRLLKRYPIVPEAYLTFLKSFESIGNPSDTTWFISNHDFNNPTDSEFRWNEFELMSLEWCEGDEEAFANIKAFWNGHIPIVLSVKEGYQFLGICLLNDGRFGEIVHGREPIFEDTTKVCDNFNDLIDLMARKELKTFD